LGFVFVKKGSEKVNMNNDEWENLGEIRSKKNNSKKTIAKKN
jgi:hypothetical protein